MSAATNSAQGLAQYDRHVVDTHFDTSPHSQLYTLGPYDVVRNICQGHAGHVYDTHFGTSFLAFNDTL